MPGVNRIEPGPGQESVWDYPRPPRLEKVERRLRVSFAGETVAETRSGYRVLETSHPPAYYFPPDDVRWEFLDPSPRQTYCEYKGTARYWTLAIGERRSEDAAWSYPQPTRAFMAFKDHLSFYASRVDGCWVDEEWVRPQPGDFYGGWITADIVGPFKGGPGTRSW